MICPKTHPINDYSTQHPMCNAYILECALLVGDSMNVNLGAPYEAIVNKAIEKEYAGNQTEVIRQALLAYERMLEEEEKELVAKAVEMEMSEVREGNTKTKSFGEVKKKFKW